MPKPFSHSASAEISSSSSGSYSTIDSGSWPGDAITCQRRPASSISVSACSTPVRSKRGQPWPVSR